MKNIFNTIIFLLFITGVSACSHTPDYVKNSLEGMKAVQESGSGCSYNYTHTNTGDNNYLRKCR